VEIVSRGRILGTAALQGRMSEQCSITKLGQVRSGCDRVAIAGQEATGQVQGQGQIAELAADLVQRHVVGGRERLAAIE
jgi:hypothetical protein